MALRPLIAGLAPSSGAPATYPAAQVTGLPAAFATQSAATPAAGNFTTLMATGVTTTLGGASVSGTALRIVSSGGYPSLTILSGNDFVGQTIDGSAFYIQPSGSIRTQIQSNLTVTGATTLGSGDTGVSGTALVVRSLANADMLHFSRVQPTDANGAYLGFYGGGSGTTIRTLFGFAHQGAGEDTIFTGETADATCLRAQGALQLGSGGDHIRLTINASGDTTLSGALTVGARLDMKSYTVGTLPAAGSASGVVYVSDAAVAPCVAFSNGTNWKRCDNAVTTVV